jgi:tetratricopeptide (TPR) repeat protein
MATIDSESINKFRRGEFNLAQAFGIDSGQVAALLLTGHTLFEQGRLESAKNIFQGLATLDARNPYVHGILGSICQKQRELPQTIAHYGKALKLYPDDINSLTNRGEVYWELGKFAEAAKDFKKAIELDPKREHPAANRARLLVVLIRDVLDRAAKDGVDASGQTRESLRP